jgi:hypothetical protein
MASYKVTRVRKERPALNPDHEHLVGVLTGDGAYHTVQEVVASIERGDQWFTSLPGEQDAAILVEDSCRHGWCMHRPYLSSAGNDTLATDLEKMPRG